MLTTEQLNAIKERAEKAQSGPWEIDDSDRTMWNLGGKNYVGSLRTFPIDDIDFISHARTDIPTLIAEVERLQKEISFIANVDMTNNAIDAEHVAVSVKCWALNVLEGCGSDD